MLKKSITSLAVAAGMMSTVAFAGGPDVAMPECEHCFRPFVGVNYTYLTLDRNNGAGAGGIGGPGSRFETSWHGLNLDFGLKYGKYIGMAFGWSHWFAQTVTLANAVRMRAAPEEIYGEVRGYYPIYNFNLIGSVGYASMNIMAITQHNFRLGIGADYWFTPNWAIAVMAHWIPSHNVTIAGYDNYWTVNAGFYYMFS